MKMKQRLVGFALAFALPVLAMAGDVGQKAYLNIAYPRQYTNGTFYSTGSNTNAFDLTAYNGIGKLIVFVSGNEGTALSTNLDHIVIQQADARTGSWATVSALTADMPTLPLTASSATSTVTAITVDLETLKNFVRIGVTTSSLAETNAGHTVGAVLVCPQKND